jgi:hypothetical protein
MILLITSNQRLNRIIKFAILACTTIFFLSLVLWIARQLFIPATKNEPPARNKIVGLNSNESMQIDGLKLNHFDGQRRVWALSAERLSVKKAKSGHFRLAFMRDALLEKVSLDFYLIGTDTRDAEVILRPLLDQLQAKSLKRFAIREFTATVHAEGDVFSVFHSSEASLDSTGQSLVLTGNVTVSVSPPTGKILRCSSLKWNGNTVEVDGNYLLSEKQGENLKSDTFLSVLEEDRQPRDSLPGNQTKLHK